MPDPATLLVLYPVLAAVLGALLGSFANVVIHRLPRGENLAWPASHCPHCQHKIAPYDNIPLLSFALLRGRCRHCHEPISPRYPIVEGATALAFATAAAAFPIANSPVSLTLMPVLLGAVITLGMWADEHTPDPRVTLPMLFLALATVMLQHGGGGLLPSFRTALITGAIGSAALPLLTGIRPHWGSSGLGAVAGVILGWLSLVLWAWGWWYWRGPQGGAA